MPKKQSPREVVERLEAEISNFLKNSGKGDMDVQFAQLMVTVAELKEAAEADCRHARQQRMVKELGYQ